MARRPVPGHVVRLINNGIRDAAVRLEGSSSVAAAATREPLQWGFLCECGMRGCFETIVWMRLCEFDALVDTDGWVLAPGHQPMRGLERVTLNRARRPVPRPLRHRVN